MNRSAGKFIIFVTVLLLSPFTVQGATIAPHDDIIGGYNCNNCHTTHKTLGSIGFSNICLTCHKPGSVGKNGDRIKSLSYNDQADPYGRLTPRPKFQTSHKWTGFDNVTAAGALPPTNPAMNNKSLLGTLSCSRCHDIHNAFSPVSPFLIGQFTKDNICLDCHRPRNTRSQLTGTHPVNFTYTSATSKVKTNPGEYYPLPVSSNPVNTTAAMQLKNGAVLCTTCHGVHYTDSNSSTYDNFTSAVFGRLSTSKGNLLRTDMRGKTVTDRNICTNCHKSADDPANTQAKVKNHNGKRQNIQCADCHGGHVEYAGANAPANELTPNVYLINRFMNISSPTGSFKTVQNKKVLFQTATPLSAQNWNNNPNGVCLACHSSLPSSVSQHSITNDASVCAGCHTHQKGFSADCTSCHGMPPVANIPGGPSGYANTPYDYSAQPFFKDESKSPHVSHAGGGTGYSYGCDECHKGNSHMTGTFQDIFIDKTGIKASTGGANPTYAPNNNAGPGTCTTTYCHSDGAGGYKPPPTWKDQKGTLAGNCNACHNLPATTTSHTKHVAGGTTGKSYSCATCHSATVNAANAIISKAKHVDGNKDVAFSSPVTGCTYCHNDARTGNPVTQPLWGQANTGNCGNCHLNPMTNYGHPAHLSAAYGPVFGTNPLNACAQCHTYTGEFAATHVDGTLNNIAGACTTCHPNGAVWTGGRVSCESCHTATLSVIYGITAPDKTQAATIGHGKPTSTTGTTMAIACTACHNSNSQHINSNPNVHYTRLFNQYTSSKTFAACNFCHNNATTVPTAKFRNMSTHFLTKGGPQAMQCWNCHDLHGSNNLSMIASKIAFINSTSWAISFTNTSTGMINASNNRGLCQVCHTQTKYFRAGAPEASHPTRNCFSCHTHNAKGGAFTPGGCNGCHGYPPVPKSAIFGPTTAGPYKGTFGTFNNYTDARYENYSGGGGAHLNHVKTDAKASEGWSNCGICHNNGQSHKAILPQDGDWRSPTYGVIGNVKVKIDQRVNFNNNFFVIYTGAHLVNKPQVNSTGICMNVGCHFQPTPRWSKDR